MSLNSLQDDMSRRAASMAAMAQRASNPQDIQSLQQRLIAGVQSGAIKPYVGIPLIQELNKKLSEVKAKMAQSVATAGMPPPAQGGAPIAQQVMAQAAQEGQGVEALPTNLPQSYAGGGIIAFEDGGQVERYQNTGYTGSRTPQEILDDMEKTNKKMSELVSSKNQPRYNAGVVSDPMGFGGSEIMSAAGTADPYVGKGLIGALTFAPDDPEWKRKLKVEQAIRERDAAMGVTPPATPAATGPINPYGQSKAGVNSLLGGTGTGGAGAGGAGVGGGSPYGKFKMPDTPTLKDYDTITKDLPKNLQSASEKAVKATQEKLEEFDKPLEAKGARLEGREAQLAKDSEISRWMALLKGGARTLAGTSRFAGENFGKGFETGIDELIRGEAANRAAKDRLEDAKDRFDEQKVAAKKGNYQAAQAAGQRAADDLRQATQLTMTGAHYGNTEALNRYQTQQQGALGIESLNLKAKELAQSGAFQNKQLAMMEQRYAAMDKASQARMAQVRATAFGKFNETVAPQISAQLVSEYGKNWRTGSDPRSLEAQMKFKQAQNAYIMDALGQYESSLSAKDSSEY